jgi:hypothetical protein
LKVIVLHTPGLPGAVRSLQLGGPLKRTQATEFEEKWAKS